VRVNVYEEELTDEVDLVWVEPQPGKRFVGVRLFLKSSPDLHHRSDDDDRCAVTIWTGTVEEARKYFMRVLHKLNQS